MAITQKEYDFLMSQDKEFDDIISPIELGPAPIHWTRKISSASTKDIFLLDFHRGSFEISRYTINKRYRQTLIMVRYDNKGRHTNPDGVSFDGPHIHLYKEGYSDKFAYPIEEVGILEEDTMEEVFNKIMHLCNIKKYPSVIIPMF